jgi:hypothetical protein
MLDRFETGLSVGEGVGAEIASRDDSPCKGQDSGSSPEVMRIPHLDQGRRAPSENRNGHNAEDGDSCNSSFPVIRKDERCESQFTFTFYLCFASNYVE